MVLEGSDGFIKQQETTKPDALAAGLTELLQGVEPADLLLALQSIQEAKEATQEPEQGKSIYQDKESVYDDEHAFIYRRGDTKSRGYYIRIYDDGSKTPFIKGLKTTDRIKAITKARTIYQEVRGKLDRGERVRTITSKELADIFIKSYEKKLTHIPKQGITPDALNVKKYFIRVWLEYIDKLGYGNTAIDRIPPEKTREYGYWFVERPREDNKTGRRSVEQANNAIGAVRQMYRDIAVRDRYISIDKIPQIDRLKAQPDERYKRDILELEQYERLWKFMYHKWIREKGIGEIEKATRIIFYNVFGILYNSGQRPKELLLMRVGEISEAEGQAEDIKRECLKLHIRKENSKTGRGRTIVVPIKKRIERIKRAYADIGIIHSPMDYLLISPTRKEKRTPFTRQTIYSRLQEVLEKSGLKEELESAGKKVSLYSSRHAYITWRLRYGNVPIHLVAKACGTSVQKIESTYGHIEVERQTELLTRAQGRLSSSGVSLVEGGAVEE